MSFKYRKLPVIIEAFQITYDSFLKMSEWPDWLIDAEMRPPNQIAALWSTGDTIWCGTLEGPHKVTIGDYIIIGVKGEIYPCKPDIFEMTYEKVDD